MDLRHPRSRRSCGSPHTTHSYPIAPQCWAGVGLSSVAPPPPQPASNADAALMLSVSRKRRGRDFRERKRVELRRDLALEPRLIALTRMLACPAAIAAPALEVLT
jgi:hypothetical protein